MTFVPVFCVISSASYSLAPTVLSYNCVYSATQNSAPLKS